MRMWMTNPKIMCRQHLLGEHLELHMIVGCLLKGKSLQGYLRKGLVELSAIEKRHNELIAEMINRGYTHKSPLPAFGYNMTETGNVNIRQNLKELLRRCKECRRKAKNNKVV